MLMSPGNRICFSQNTGTGLYRDSTDSYLIRQGALASKLPHAETLPFSVANLMDWFQLPPFLSNPSLFWICQWVKQIAKHRGMDSCHGGMSHNEVVQHLHQAKKGSTGAPSDSTCSGTAALYLLRRVGAASLSPFLSIAKPIIYNMTRLTFPLLI